MCLNINVLFSAVRLYASLNGNNYSNKAMQLRIRILDFKGTLMQIWKSHYMFLFIWMQYPEDFAFLILRILELFASEFYKFLKK